MNKQRKPRVAICYDFDGTLSPKNMQEYDFIPQLKMKPGEFWSEAEKRAKAQETDSIITYMCLMLEKANMYDEVKIRKEDFEKYGKTIELFPGAEKWFGRMNKFAKDHGVIPEHYIISSGIREMIEGTKVAKEFKKVFASSFYYDKYGIAKWPGMAINYTTKTQFLFRINKGVLDVSDNDTINHYVSKSDRPVPFEHMIYIGDGSTDIPCMKLVKEQGGHSIAVYKPNSNMAKARKLLKEQRVDFVLPADYRPKSQLDKRVRAIIIKICADFGLRK